MIILGTNSVKDTGYDVDNSVRVQTGAYMSGSNGTATNNDKYTISFWVKRGKLTGTTQFIIEGFSGALNDTGFGCIRFRDTDVLDIQGYNATYARTNRVFRDISAWYHIVVAYDTTLGTADDRIKLYINGVEETSLSIKNNPTQNQNTGFNNNSAAINFFRRRIQSSNDLHGNGYFSEFCMIDGQQLDATSFGEFDEDSGIWKPIDVSGLTFGNNGFYLDFKNSGALGADVSGNTNNFTVNNLTAIDQSTDTCTNNGAVLNNLYSSSGTGFSEGNLNYTYSSSAWRSALSTIAPNKGKWYCENKFVSGVNTYFGICDVTQAETFSGNFLGVSLTNSTGIALARYDGKIYANGSIVFSGSAVSNGDIIGIALDLDNNYVYFSVNGTFLNSGNPASGSSGTGGFALPNKVALANYVFGVSSYAGGVLSTNFGSPSYSESGGNSDGNGYGNFKTAPTSGYYSLNSKNLAEYG